MVERAVVLVSSYLVWASCGGETPGADGVEEGSDTSIEASSSISSAATSGAETSSSTAVCGNGVLEPGEECDDGNGFDGDGCSATCESTDQSALQVAVGACSCAVLSEGRLRCWGDGGCTGWGTDFIFAIGDDEPPAALGDLPLDFVVTQVSMGVQHNCVLTGEGSVRCWGIGVEQGQLGLGDVLAIREPRTLADARDAEVGAVVVHVEAGPGRHSCALIQGGALRCWGGNEYGQLGHGHVQNIGDDELPSSAGDVDVGGRVTQVVLGDSHTCALLDEGGVRCWGRAADESGAGYLGYGNLEMIGDDEDPSAAPTLQLGGPAMALSADRAHTCALLVGGDVVCWGAGALGKLGYASEDDVGDDEVPADVGHVEIGEPAVAIEVGAAWSCAVLSDGRLKCWGSNGAGYLGSGVAGNVGDDETPLDALEAKVGDPVLALSSGQGHTCALLSDARIRCWGWNPDGRLGYGNTPFPCNGLCGGAPTECCVGDDETPALVGDVPYE